jgi:hypothetical protein
MWWATACNQREDGPVCTGARHFGAKRVRRARAKRVRVYVAPVRRSRTGPSSEAKPSASSVRTPEQSYAVAAGTPTSGSGGPADSKSCVYSGSHTVHDNGVPSGAMANITPPFSVNPEMFVVVRDRLPVLLADGAEVEQLRGDVLAYLPRWRTPALNGTSSSRRSTTGRAGHDGRWRT